MKSVLDINLEVESQKKEIERLKQVVKKLDAENRILKIEQKRLDPATVSFARREARHKSEVCLEG